MAQKKVTYASPAQAAADKLLAELQEAVQKHSVGNAAIMSLMQEWAAVTAPLKGEVYRLDAELRSLMKDHQVDFFVIDSKDGLGSCSLDLPHGALLYDKTDYVVKPRKVDVLANLERYGFEEAIRRTAAVDWEALNNKEEWPDEVLGIIGTRREVKETFAYELSPSPQPSPLKGEGVKQEA